MCWKMWARLRQQDTHPSRPHSTSQVLNDSFSQQIKTAQQTDISTGGVNGHQKWSGIPLGTHPSNQAQQRSKKTLAIYFSSPPENLQNLWFPLRRSFHPFTRMRIFFYPATFPRGVGQKLSRGRFSSWFGWTWKGERVKKNDTFLFQRMAHLLSWWGAVGNTSPGYATTAVAREISRPQSGDKCSPVQQRARRRRKKKRGTACLAHKTGAQIICQFRKRVYPSAWHPFFKQQQLWKCAPELHSPAWFTLSSIIHLRVIQ